MKKNTKRTILKCGKLFDVRSESVRQNVAVVVEGERIREVCAVEAVDFSGAEVIDLSDRFVMPGLIDAHTHIVMDGQLAPFQEMLYTNHATSTINGLLRAKRDLLAGFTTIRDCGGCRTGDDCAIRDAINEGKIEGPRMLVSGPFHTTSSVQELYQDAGVTVDGADMARKAAREAIARGVDQIKLLGVGHWSDAEMQAMVEVADAMGKLTCLHAVDQTTIEMGVRAGIHTIEHGLGITEAEIRLMAERGTYLVPTYAPIYYAAVRSAYVAAKYDSDGQVAELSEEEKQALRDRYAAHAEKLPAILAGGVKVGFGSDVGSIFVRHGEQARELVLMAENGMSNTEALLAATRTNAEMLRLEQDLGSIEGGKYADIIAFAEDATEKIETVLECKFVMKGGVVYRAE